MSAGEKPLYVLVDHLNWPKLKRLKHSFKVKIKEKMTNKEKNRIQKTTRFSGWTWQQYKIERKKKANCAELFSIVLCCFSGVFFP